MSTAERMQFKIEEKEKFSDWVLRVQPRLEELACIVSRKSRTEIEKGMQEDLTAHLDLLLENLSDIKLEVSELCIRSKEYYQDWLARATAEELGLGWTKAKKTAQDFAGKTNSSEKRIMDRVEAMNATIEYRTIVAQSMLKSLKA